MSGGYRVYLEPSKRFPSLLHCAFCYRGTMSVLASEVRLGRGCGVYRMLKTIKISTFKQGTIN